MMYRRSKPLLAVATATVLAGLVAGCGGKAPVASANSNQASSGNTTSSSTTSTSSSGSGAPQKLIVGYEATATSMDPGQVTDINTMQVLTQMYDTLVNYNSNGKIIPDLATKWSMSSDKLSYTFTLKSGVKFSNGDPLTASDVVYSFERMLDKNNPGYQYGPYPFGNFFFGNVKSVTAVSTNQVKFTLSTPTGAFLSDLTTPTAMIVDKKVALKDGKNFASAGAGTGPFMVKSWQRGVDLKLVDNPYYWGTKPKLKEIDFTPISQQTQRAQDLQSGSVDMVINPAPNSLSALQSAGYTVDMAAGPHIWWIGLNMTKKPFNNKLVRQALNYAINRKAIIKGILYGTGIPADQPLSPQQLGYNKNVNPYTYNPQKAKQLLAQAGYPNGFSTTLLVPTSGSGMQSPKQMGTAIQGYLKAVGINVKIQELDWGTYLNKVNQGAKKANMDMWELSWMDSALDPSMVLGPLLVKSSWPPGFNSGFYSDPKVNKLVAQAAQLTTPSKRAPLYQQAESLINQDAPWIFVDHAKQIVALNKKVQGFALDPIFPFLIHLNTVSVK